jgi:DNA replication and repair protein RecF
LVSTQPRLDLLRTDLDKVLRQRNALLRQSGGRLTDEIELTLAVWDTTLVEVGEALAHARELPVEDLRPALARAYPKVAGATGAVGVRYVAPWRERGLAVALAEARRDELRRGVSLVGPHRDEVELTIGGLPSRTHASQGEQRSLALALRLAAHEVVTDATGSPPILLLDDVFSELDPTRSAALLEHLPTGQTLLSSAAGLPPGAHPDVVLRVHGGTVTRDHPVG